jgi:error-prone DNA polymerase
MDLDRRQALWEVSALDDRPIGIFKGQSWQDSAEGKIILPPIAPMEHVIQDYAATTLSLKAHPVSFVRERLDQLHVTPTAGLASMANGAFVKVCGLITVRQRPGTAKGVLFITVEDETGFANLVVWSKTYEKYRKVILQSRLFMVTGKLQVEGEVIHVVVRSCHNLTGLVQLAAKGRDIGSVHAPAHAGKKGTTGAENPMGKKTVQGELFPSRDFR